MKVTLPLTLSLIIVAFILGLTGGYFFSPAYQATMYGQQEMGLGQADRFVDLRYLDQMATHHLGAIALADQVATTSQRPEILALSAEIQQNEPKLIAELQQWKREWYNDPRSAIAPQVAQLGSADDKLDLRFLNALIAHHEAGIAMTKEIRTKSSRAQVLDNADAVEAFLSGSIVDLKAWRMSWYGV